MRKAKSESRVKCPNCHAYFVDEGEICNNCKKLQHTEEAESEE